MRNLWRPQRDLNASEPLPNHAGSKDSAELGGEGDHSPSLMKGAKAQQRPDAGDPAERAFAEALTLAARADKWETVDRLLAERKAHREARAGVVELAAERKRRRS